MVTFHILVGIVYWVFQTYFTKKYFFSSPPNILFIDVLWDTLSITGLRVTFFLFSVLCNMLCFFLLGYSSNIVRRINNFHCNSFSVNMLFYDLSSKCRMIQIYRNPSRYCCDGDLSLIENNTCLFPRWPHEGAKKS